jgi:hypothetical protein
MPIQKGKGVASYTNNIIPNLQNNNLDPSYDSPNLTPRPSKINNKKKIFKKIMFKMMIHHIHSFIIKTHMFKKALTNAKKKYYW